jgi:hypothetical protein
LKPFLTEQIDRLFGIDSKLLHLSKCLKGVRFILLH